MATLLKTLWCLAFLVSLAMAWPATLYGQDDAGADLSEDEARQVQVAARFLSILEKNPRRGTALDRVYGHHVEFGTLGTFLDGLKERVQAEPADGAGWMILGLVESLRGEDASAVDALTHAEQSRTDDPLASYYLGQSLLLVGRPEEGVDAFERAIQRQPERADLLEIYQQLGRVHQRAQRDEAARDVWERLESLFPEDPRVLEQIAVTLTEEGEYAAALERYERLVGLVEDEYRQTTFRMQVAELKIRENRRDDGLADLEQLLSDLNPESWLYRDVRRRIEDVFVRSGDQDGMVQYYERWLSAHPQDLDAMARLASFLANAARVPEAMEWMDKALKLAPSRVELRRAFIRQLVDDQRYTEAIQQYALLSAAAPGNVDVLREWGRTVLKDPSLTEEARRTEATRIWNLIVAAQPDDALTVAQVADLFRQAKFNDEAIALYEKAVALAPDDPHYREYLGEFRHILGQKDEALAVWREIAADGRRNALNLARLSEVLSRFSYPEEAADTVAQAAAADLKDISLQMQAANYHTEARRFDEALQYIAVAEGLSQNDEESDAILRQKIETLQAADRLDAQTESLHAQLQSTANAPAADWHTLARYFEAAREWTDATTAIQQALALEPQSIAFLTSASRIAELSGDFGRAADILRELATVDRRSRGDHLTNVARIEAQLGRSEQALQAGRDLIISAPGNTEHYEFYAQLCFRLARTNEGIDALRKAVRINPTDPDLMSTLAAALASDFRTDEAIQLYWQAFEKAEELEDQTGLVMKLTELHLQLNQFDRLIERLERGRREEESRRAMTICIAQALHTSGDYGTARTELESLLSNDTRDTELLLQLSKLCEAGQDFEAAADYQRQVASIAPGPETEYRLAQMLQLHGDNEQATEILSQLLLREEDPIRMLKGVDSLLNQTTFEEALAVIEPLRRDRRDDWELLYREGVAWASLERA
ncbi:MAG: tetratricopeptide repeat protein, partial [Planctomycetaceae bacterium]|nr:tetratricopeptide repeat protein [Planctomycetaceae bacterium]